LRLLCADALGGGIFLDFSGFPFIEARKDLMVL